MKRKSISCMVLMILLLIGSVPALLFATGNQEKTTNAKGDAFDSTGKLVSSPATIRILMTDSAPQPLKNYAPAQQAIFEKTGVKLDYEIVPFSSYDDKKNILLATNNWPDLAYIKVEDVATYAPTGIFQPLMQYVNEKDMPNFYKFWQEYPEMKKYLLDGELYVFPVIQREESANGYGPVIRTDLLKANNLPIPQSFDELLQELAQLKKIYPNSIPWTGRKGTTQLLKTTSYMLGSGYEQVGIYYDFDKGKYVFGPASQEFKAVLATLNKAYSMGVLDPDFATTTSEQLESKMSSGRSFFFLDNSGFGVNYTKALRKLPGNEDAVLQIIPIPKNSFGESRAISYPKELPGRFYAVNAGSKNIETVVKLVDWLYGKEGSDISNYGKEGYSFEYNAAGEPEFKMDYVEKFRDATPSSYYAIYSDLGITKLNFSMYACNTKTWFEIEKMLGNWDSISDEYWKIVANDKAYHSPVINPSLTIEESERTADILMELNTMLAQEYNKYIMGLEPVQNWDKVIKRCESMGVRELEQIYNDANARAMQR
ncbi:extracellular solute-binding protein [uncultured Sphaerochaeta sp.]|uniref:extracellular solute-binding protein n=1 Tax=uncultured Sphaerochaeta sp. TaxID=886478 RepID=UPI002A0A2DA2|nr:extracellular solute-binding protein [uncultured Sphaerochaeta sp.]